MPREPPLRGKGTPYGVPRMYAGKGIPRGVPTQMYEYRATKMFRGVSRAAALRKYDDHWRRKAQEAIATKMFPGTSTETALRKCADIARRKAQEAIATKMFPKLTINEAVTQYNKSLLK